MKTLSVVLITLGLNLIIPVSFLLGQTIQLKTDKGITEFPTDYSEQGPERKSAFPTFKRVDINGDSINLDLLMDKLLIINIWFVGCSGCKQEEEYLKKIALKYKDNDNVKFISFCMSSEDKIKKYFNKAGDFGYKTISIKRKEVENDFKVITSPTHFIVKNGILVEKFTRPVSGQTIYNWFLKRIEGLL